MKANNTPSYSNKKIVVNIFQQKMYVYIYNNLNNSDHIELYKTYSVSTAKNGIGNIEGSGCTPLGKHVIAEKIGDEMPINTVYVGRMATGERYNDKLNNEHPNRDWILTRILWLRGCQDGLNQGINESGSCDTYSRYIYIHGTPDSEPMGIPLSHGCIRMRNDDILELFDLVDVNTLVDIIAK